jgi:class 3 adenylate cyclase
MQNPYLEWADENGKTCCLEVVDKVFIGRSCKGIQSNKCIIVKDSVVSRDHASISLSASGLDVKDMSTNGVWVNDIRIAAGSSRKLINGDKIRVGSKLFFVRCPDLVSLEEDVEATENEPIKLMVTNLVADLRGFSNITQAQDSNYLYDLMRTIFDTFSAVVCNHSGTIKDYVGDAIYAFWDHSLSAKKAWAQLACQTALEQSEALKRLSSSRYSRIGSPLDGLQMGWGITTGNVTMAHYGSRVADVAVVGDSTNLAFRLSCMANKDLPSEIVICSKTAQLVGDTLPVVDLGSVAVRGRSGREHVYGIQ